jgi:TolA-binding protein
MVAVVLTTGNHYVLDVVGSAVLLAAAIAVASLYGRLAERWGTIGASPSPAPARGVVMTSDTALNTSDPLADDDRSPIARLRRAELRVAHLEGQVEALQAQVAAFEATDEHRRNELAEARADTAEAQAQVREAQARAEERRHLIDELRGQLSETRVAGADDHAKDAAKSEGWRARRRAGRT